MMQIGDDLTAPHTGCFHAISTLVSDQSFLIQNCQHTLMVMALHEN